MHVHMHVHERDERLAGLLLSTGRRKESAHIQVLQRDQWYKTRRRRASRTRQARAQRVKPRCLFTQAQRALRVKGIHDRAEVCELAGKSPGELLATCAPRRYEAQHASRRYPPRHVKIEATVLLEHAGSTNLAIDKAALVYVLLDRPNDWLVCQGRSPRGRRLCQRSLPSLPPRQAKAVDCSSTQCDGSSKGGKQPALPISSGA